MAKSGKKSGDKKIKKRGGHKRLIMMIIMFAIGGVLMCYPWIANYHNQRQAQSYIAAVEQELEDVDDAEKEQWLEMAREYNEGIYRNQSSLYDAFGTYAAEDSTDYYDQLAYSETGIMGWIDIPSINIYVPIFHGVADEALEVGSGHLEGSSLPVGGENTHSVLVGHTGLAGKKLFTDLDQLQEGDWFFIHILGDTLAYQVTGIEVVWPYETDDLMVREGEDLVTLVTCTPYGINDHRLYVTGTRGEYSDDIYRAETKKDYRSQSEWMERYKSILAIMIIIILIIIAIRGSIANAKRRKKRKMAAMRKKRQK